MLRIFITRNITQTSVFYQALHQQYKIVGQSLLRLEALDFEPLSDTDWLFFYSKNGVRFFFENENNGFENKKMKIATIGESTAKALEKMNLKADFIGNGRPESVANTFLRHCKEQSVTFIRAQNSRQSVQQLLIENMEIIDRAVYNNEINLDAKLPKAIDILVCTSPMNAQAFLHLYNGKKQPTKAIAIGKTTAKAMLELGFEDITVAQTPNEEGLMEAVEQARS